MASHKKPFVTSVVGIISLIMYKQRAQSILSNGGNLHHTSWTGWGKDGEIDTACILGPFRDNSTHCGRGYASVGTVGHTYTVSG